MRKNIIHTFSLSIIVTHRCNLGCAYCLRSANNKRSEIPFASLDKIIRTFHERGCRSCTITGGEALLYTHLEQLLDLLRTLDWRIFLETNGIKIGDDKIRSLIGKMPIEKLSFLVSLDSHQKKNHDEFRGAGSWIAAERAIRFLKGMGFGVAVNSVFHKRNMISSFDLFRFIEKMIELRVNECFFSPVVSIGRSSANKFSITPREVEQVTLLLNKARKFYTGRIVINRGAEDSLGYCGRLNGNNAVVSYRGFHPCLYFDDFVFASLEDISGGISFIKRMKYLKKAADLFAGQEKSKCYLCTKLFHAFTNKLPYKLYE